MDWLGFIIIGMLAGWVAGLLTKGSGHGLVGNLVVGIIGALAGGFLFELLNIQAGGGFGSFVTAVIGAVVVLYLIRFFKKI